MKKTKIQYIANAVKWFDKVNGNTYHSVKITRTSDGAQLKSCNIVYGYGDQYRYTALELMGKAGWLSKKYTKEAPRGGTLVYMFERENGYPIQWNVHDGLKREMYANVL